METLLSTWRPSYAYNSKFRIYPSQIARSPLNIPRYHPVSFSYKDFQDYANPKRLLPSRKLKRYGDESLPKLISNGSHTVYKVVLKTSRVYDAGLSDWIAGVLVCIIDKRGDSILERLASFQTSEDVIHFERGSLDEFLFLGPNLGPVRAIWISLESGTWRLGGASLMTISACNDQAVESSANGSLYRCLTYNFEVEDVLIGEGGDLTMAEFVPSQVTECAGLDPFAILDKNAGQAASLADRRIKKEDSMREYTNLKYSLLLYDSILIFAGTFLSSFTGENAAIAFFTGGIGGFLYLLLLQRSVDRLPAPESDANSHKSYFDRLFREVKGPLLVLAFAFGVAVLAAKRGSPDVEPALSPREIIVGISGFLACKVSVWLAAFKPLSIGVEDNSR